MPIGDFIRVGEQLMKHVGNRIWVLGWEARENSVVRRAKFIFKLPKT